MTGEFVINLLSAFFAFSSGIMWIISAKTKGINPDTKDELETNSGVAIDATLQHQSKWSARAAIFAAVAAFLQSISLFTGL